MSTSTQNGPADGLPDLEAFSKMSSDLYKQWESSVSGWWDQLVESPGFLDQASQSMAQMSRMREQYEQSTDEALARMHLPSKGDVTRLARIATLLEKRVLDVDDRVLELTDALAERDARIARLEAEVVQARIEAAEARLELRTTLEALQERLAAIDTAKPRRSNRSAAAKKAAATRKANRAKKTAAKSDDAAE